MRKIRPDDPLAQRTKSSKLPKQVHIDPNVNSCSIIFFLSFFFFCCFIKSPHSTAHVTCILNYFSFLRLPFCFCSMPYVGLLARCCYYVWLLGSALVEVKWARFSFVFELGENPQLFVRENPFCNLIKSPSSSFSSSYVQNRNIFHNLFQTKITFLFLIQRCFPDSATLRIIYGLFWLPAY